MQQLCPCKLVLGKLVLHIRAIYHLEYIGLSHISVYQHVLLISVDIKTVLKTMFGVINYVKCQSFLTIKLLLDCKI